MAGLIPAQARRNNIAQLLLERDSVSVAELTARFGVTDTSIRHDLTVLQKAGKLRRVHGGAVSHLSAGIGNGASARAHENIAEKKAIGQRAAGLIQLGDAVLFDSGSTVAQLVLQVPEPLRASDAITIVTHSLPVIEEVGSWEQPHLICLGGLYLPTHRASVGPLTLANLRDLTADVAFLGCDGLTVEGGLTTPHMLIAQVGAALAASARKVVALADATKLGRAGFTPIVPLEAVDVLVTDQRADRELVAQIRAAGVEVILA
ncbi:MAG: DeoR/GlpR family DNA-binding transcription regulator [Candidatus Dormibacteria bacterium]|jgi:DeoR/GlpR family transcriptional regulator of sugar metabolism